jgi:hypothetical protein
MKFLKVLLNSLITGLYFSFLVGLLVWDLNINLEFIWQEFAQFSLYLMPVYGLVVVFFSIVFFFMIQFFSDRPFKIAVISPSFLMISFTLVTLIFHIFFRKNLRHFSTLFSPATQELLDQQFWALVLLAALGVFAVLALILYRRKVFFLIVYFLVFFAATAYTLWQRMQFPGVPSYEKIATLETRSIDKRITLIALEGMSFDFIIPLSTEGKLPNFSYLMDNGSWGTLQNFTPNVPLVLNNSLSTGKFPAAHRRLSTQEYTLINLERSIQVIPRYIFFRQVTKTGLLTTQEVIPPKHIMNIWDIFHANQTTFVREDWPYERFAGVITPEAETIFNRFYEDLRFETSETFLKAKQAFCSDIELEAMITQQKEQLQPQLLYFLLPGLNKAQDYFYKYSYPDFFGEIEQEELSKYNTVLERYYQYYDEVIGKYLAAKKDDELLVVFSPHGTEALPLWKQIFEWFFGDPDISAYHENAPEGTIFFIGKDVAAGRNIEGMQLIDLAPTLLHYLGLPVGKDMDGIVNSTIFVEEFKSEPVLFISSYEEHEIKAPDQQN